MNPLKEIFTDTRNVPYKIADSIGMSRSYIYRIIADGGIPRETKIATLDRIAEELGYSVKITFEKDS